MNTVRELVHSLSLSLDRPSCKLPSSPLENFTMIDLFVVFTVVFTASVLFWRYGTRASRILQRCRVPVVPGALPFVGNALQFLKADHLGAFDCDNIKKFGKVYGVCEMIQPLLIVADPVMLKEILLRQFNNFTDRRKLPLRKLMKYSMLDQTGAEWKRLRTMVTPFFSSSKLRKNVPIMNKSIQRFLENLQHIYEKDNLIEARSVCGSMTLEAISMTAFSLDAESKDDKSFQLFRTLKSLINIKLSSPAFFITFAFPILSPILEFFGISMFPSGYLKRFETATKQMIDDRKNRPNNQVRPDFIQAMVKAHLEELDYQTKIALYGEDHANYEDLRLKRGLTDKEIMAQTLLIFLAGQESTALTLSLFLYNMALNPDVQEKLYNEIIARIGNQEPNYENISALKYLDMCLSESLRIFPPLFRFNRETANDVVIENITIPKGAIVSVPVWAIHRDPDLWPSPETYDPERFSGDVDQMAYMPFGVGQRSCIGNRFALLELKAAIIEILRSFRIFPNHRTQIPIEFVNAIFLQPKAGVWLSVEPRRKPDHNTCRNLTPGQSS